MKYDKARIDDAVLALLETFSFDGGRSWKGYDWGVMDRLHERGLITQPAGKRKSIHLTEEGEALGRQVAERLFGVSESESAPGDPHRS